MSSVFNDDDVLHLLELVLVESDPTLARLCVQVVDYLGVPVASVADRVKLPPDATGISAVYALIELSSLGCVDLCLRLAVHPNPTLRHAALESLEDVDDPRIGPALHSLLPDPDPEVQRTLERVRGSLDCLEVRRRVPRRPSWLTVSEARLARLLVGKVPAAEIAHARAMRNSDIAVVRESALRYCDERVIEALATLKSKLTVEALALLESLGDSRAVPCLEETGLSSDPIIGAAQIRVLRSLADEGAVNVLITWLAGPSGLESQIWLALADLGEVAAPHVTRVLPTLSVERRVAAARIANAGWPEPILFALLNDANLEVRLAAVSAISSEINWRNARVATGLLVGVIALSNQQSVDDGRVAEAALLGITTVAGQGFSEHVIEALDAALGMVENATRDLLIDIRKGLEPLLRRSFEKYEYLESLSGSYSVHRDLGDGSDYREDDRRHKVTDRISFSVTSPMAVAPADIFTLSVWAHSDDQREEVVARAQSEQGRPVRVASRGPVHVPCEALLTIQVDIPAFGISAEDTIGWFGEIGHAAFQVTVPANAPRGPVGGSLRVYAGALKISRLEFVLEVGARATRIRRARALERRVRSGFASYASDDRDEVMGRIQGMLKIAPALDIFVDAFSLRSGEHWEERLIEEISARDVLYLFWSLAASRSEMVDREWRWALQNRGLEFIDPVPLQPPSIVPPPRELASLHFSDWTLAFKQ